MIEARSLTKEADGKRLLDEISFKLLNGGIYGILGQEREGKALLALLAGAAIPTSGSVRINGFDTVADEKKAKRCTASFLSLSMLCEELTVHEFLMFVAQARGADYEKGVRQARQAEELCELYEQRERMIRNLSLDERVRLCLAQTTVGGAEIILVAMPFGGMDPDSEEDLIPLLKEIAKGRTLFVSDTRRECLCAFCDTLLTVEDGRLISVEALAHEEQAGDPDDACEKGEMTE